jgi:hypothetical protein
MKIKPQPYLFREGVKMTKKHFIAMAQLVRDHEASVSVRQILADAFARTGQQFNPNFSQVRFMAACGLTPPPPPKRPSRQR